MNNELTVLLEKFTCGDDNQAEDSAKVISSFGDMIIPKLEYLLESQVEDERWWAVRTLSLMEDPPYDQIIRMLGDDSVEVRKCAALAILNHPTVSALDLLVDLLEDYDPLMANLAANALISIGASAVSKILDKLGELEGLARIEAFRALAKIGDTGAISVFFSGLNDQSHLVAYWSEEGLTKLAMDMVYLQPG